MERKEYKKIVDKLVKTIKKKGIPEKVKKWKVPELKYDFKNDEEFYEYLLMLSQSYDKHTFTAYEKEEEEIVKEKEEEEKKIVKDYKKKNMKHPIVKMIKNNILYIKFYHYFQNITGWKEDLDKWVKIVKLKIDKQLQKEPKGIIIDLTEHYGGNMWPAIYSMYNIYGDNSLLRLTADKKWTNIVKEKNTKGVFKNKDLKFTKPIGVIVSTSTISSGELIAATFAGRKNTFLLGDKTNKSGGYMSMNGQYPLVKDWIISLILTESFVETVDGKVHTLEYLRVKKSNNPIKEASEKIRQK